MNSKAQSGASGAQQQRWPINEDVLQKIVQQQREDALNPRLKERERRAAQKLVLEFETNRKSASDGGQQAVSHSKVFYDLPPVEGKEHERSKCDLGKLSAGELLQLEALLLKASGSVSKTE